MQKKHPNDFCAKRIKKINWSYYRMQLLFSPTHPSLLVHALGNRYRYQHYHHHPHGDSHSLVHRKRMCIQISPKKIDIALASTLHIHNLGDSVSKANKTLLSPNANIISCQNGRRRRHNIDNGPDLCWETVAAAATAAAMVEWCVLFVLHLIFHINLNQFQIEHGKENVRNALRRQASSSDNARSLLTLFTIGDCKVYFFICENNFLLLLSASSESLPLPLWPWLLLTFLNFVKRIFGKRFILYTVTETKCNTVSFVVINLIFSAKILWNTYTIYFESRTNGFVV